MSFAPRSILRATHGTVANTAIQRHTLALWTFI